VDSGRGRKWLADGGVKGSGGKMKGGEI